MLKIPTQEKFNKFIQELRQKLSAENSREKTTVEEEKIEKSPFTPKVIDSTMKMSKEKPQELTEEDFEHYKAELVNIMPKNNYTIDLGIKSICLTCTIKNTGDVEWPSGFYVGLIDTDCDKLDDKVENGDLIIYNPIISKSVKPKATININVMLRNPTIAGTFTYTLAMHTLSGIKFGTEFEFTFTVMPEGLRGAFWDFGSS